MVYSHINYLISLLWIVFGVTLYNYLFMEIIICIYWHMDTKRKQTSHFREIRVNFSRMNTYYCMLVMFLLISSGIITINVNYIKELFFLMQNSVWCIFSHHKLWKHVLFMWYTVSCDNEILPFLNIIFGCFFLFRFSPWNISQNFIKYKLIIYYLFYSLGIKKKKDLELLHIYLSIVILIILKTKKDL